MFLAVAVSALTLVRYWVLSAPYPPGLDGAQWLSYGRALFGGAGRGAESVYAPLIPLVVHGLSLAFGPFLGLRVATALLLILIACAILLLCVQLLGRTWGPLMAALVLPCTAFAEPVSYGGIPQQAALALGVLGLSFIVRASDVQKSCSAAREIAAAAICFVLASASHLLFGPLLLLTAAITSLGQCAGRANQRAFLLRSTFTLLPAAATSFLVAWVYFHAGYVAPLAVSQRTPGAAWSYATRESTWFWTAIVIGGILASLYIVLRRRFVPPTVYKRDPFPTTVIVGFALVVPAAVLMIASGQPRLAPSVLLGGTILAGFAIDASTRWRTHARLATVASCCLAAIWLAGITTGFTREFAQFYQVLNPSLVSATRTLPSPATGAIAVAADQRGWPVGWWVEALQTAPVLVGSDPRWLAFPAEQVQARTVANLLASPDGSILQQRAEDAGIAYLMLRKWDWIGWERWMTASADAPMVIYDDNETIILRIVPATPERLPA